MAIHQSFFLDFSWMQVIWDVNCFSFHKCCLTSYIFCLYLKFPASVFNWNCYYFMKQVGLWVTLTMNPRENIQLLTKISWLTLLAKISSFIPRYAYYLKRPIPFQQFKTTYLFIICILSWIVWYYLLCGSGTYLDFPAPWMLLSTSSID